jgi:hypothetical protein
MRALLAGFVSGAAGAFAMSAILLIALAQGVRHGHGLRFAGWERVRLPLIGAVLVNVLMLLWTALGLCLGAGYLRAASHHPGGGLGTPNALFTLLVAGGVALLLGMAAFVLRRLPWPVWSTGVVAVLAFAFMLPNLAR